jgi:uncharacterized protein YabE (DUF348 family)
VGNLATDCPPGDRNRRRRDCPSAHPPRACADLLLDLGIQPDATDRIEPSQDSPVTRGLAVSVERARPVRVLADGRDLLVRSWGDTPAKVLAGIDMALDTGDQVLIDGVRGDGRFDCAAAERRMATHRGYLRPGFCLERVCAPSRCSCASTVRFPIVVHEGELPYTIRTTAETVGEALRGAEVDLYLGDRVQPSLGSRATANMHIHIQRSTPVSLVIEGGRLKTRTRADDCG